MKVGCFLGDFIPDAGGASTFESEIFHALVEYGSESGHTFMVYSWRDEPPSEIASLQHIQFTSLLKYEQQNRVIQHPPKGAILSKILTYLKGEATPVFPKPFMVEDIDMLWYLTPFRCLTMELPYITTVWDLQHRLQPFFPEVSTDGRWNNRERFYATMVRRAACILTGTEEAKTEITHFYQVASENIKVLPLPTPRFALEASRSDETDIFEKYHIPERYVFYPAQFWPHKNHIGLLHALKWLRETHELTIPAVFVGSDQGNLGYVKQMVSQLGLSAHVFFLGFVPREDLIALYRHAFALTFVSLFGPDNLPPLEAFALGCPVIASDVSGMQEQLGEAALFVNPTNEKQIALAIKTLSETPELRQTLIDRGQERASKWTGRNYIQGVLTILDEFACIRRCWTSQQSLRIQPYGEWLNRFPLL